MAKGIVRIVGNKAAYGQDYHITNEDRHIWEASIVDPMKDAFEDKFVEIHDQWVMQLSNLKIR